MHRARNREAPASGAGRRIGNSIWPRDKR
jgi:hypothetical protein